MFVYRHKATCERPVIDDGVGSLRMCGVCIINVISIYMYMCATCVLRVSGICVASFDNFVFPYPNSFTCKDDGSTSKFQTNLVSLLDHSHREPEGREGI